MNNGKPCEAHSIPVDICARCRGAAEERDRIIAILYAQLSHYNQLIGNAKSSVFKANMESRKKGVIEAIKLARMTDLEAAEVFRKKSAK